jgi:hypothetical protein
MADTDDSRERQLARMRAWHAANREKMRAYKRAWYRTNPEKAKEISRKNRDRKRENPQLMAYNTHIGNARQRGVAFLLTFDEWWGIWNASGKWEQRGARKDHYVMARLGDVGPYAVGNVRICTHAENNAEANRLSRGKPASAGELAAMAKARAARWAHGRTISDRQREALARAQEARWPKRHT